MSNTFSTLKVAVIQAAPVLFNRDATVEKTCTLTAEAATQGANIIPILDLRHSGAARVRPLRS